MMASYSGRQKIVFRKQLGEQWQDLADYCEISVPDQEKWIKGEEAREIWGWLEQRNKLNELVEALNYIERQDIVLEVLHSTKQDKMPEPSKIITTSPYPGLRAFTEDESQLFFGRTPEILALLDIMKKNRFLAVIGASGSGKSSLVRAGVLPQLTNKAGDKRWDWLRFTPGGIGDDPFMALAVTLTPALERLCLTPREIATQLQKRGNIDEMAEKYLAQKPATGQLILFIDQFEELFTLVAECHRQRFINLLEKAVQSPYLCIILTVRADFHEHCLNYAALAGLVNTGAWHLASPESSALWQMIDKPARAAGLQFESGLIEQILRDTGTGSGALALMAFTLEQLYLACAPATTLTWKAYDRLGRVNQAIGHHAQKTYDNLDKAVQNALGEVFAELVTVDPERGIATRKRADFARIGQTDAARQLIDAFIEARLLVKSEINDTDAKTSASVKETVVEVAHEAVLTHWELLKNWINERFGDFCLLRQVRMEAIEWERNGCPEVNLWPHERLQKVYDMQQKLKPQLSESVCAFIQPEVERLLENINNPALTHQQRERIGVRLAEIDDSRPGIGVDENGLPQFEWCPVPSGPIELEGKAGTFNVTAFFMSQYPVTFKQYRAFLEAADGYHNPLWWTDLKHEPEPGAQYRKIDNHPADGVSWYDAVAFCHWLSDKRGFEIRLPAEWEWQQAATGGDPNNEYPWGKDFNSLCCNTWESGLGRTMAIGMYPAGKSLVGTLDMSGNVWEWCLNDYDKPETIDISSDGRRVVRGGSWDYSRDLACAAYRFHYTPDFRNYLLGFRVVCSSPII
jgi:formylglycine-generating enzyme required for sulfatase activity/energy-coupling factor transporter ATP-binding protein EcfA2